MEKRKLDNNDVDEPCQKKARPNSTDPNASKTLVEHQHHILTTSLFFDISVQTAFATYKLHKNVISRSLYFSTLFSSNFSDNTDTISFVELEKAIPSISKATYDAIWDALYTATINVPQYSWNEWKGITQVANFLQFELNTEKCNMGEKLAILLLQGKPWTMQDAAPLCELLYNWDEKTPLLHGTFPAFFYDHACKSEFIDLHSKLVLFSMFTGKNAIDATDFTEHEKQLLEQIVVSDACPASDWQGKERVAPFISKSNQLPYAKWIKCELTIDDADMSDLTEDQVFSLISCCRMMNDELWWEFGLQSNLSDKQLDIQLAYCDLATKEWCSLQYDLDAEVFYKDCFQVNAEPFMDHTHKTYHLKCLFMYTQK